MRGRSSSLPRSATPSAPTKDGADAVRRVELLRLRFEEDLPIRTIAESWNTDAVRVHREYAKARAEFRAALKAGVQEHHGGEPRAVDAECARLLGLLG